MDKRKGLKRLALGVVIPYFGIWWTYGILSWINHEEARRQFIATPEFGEDYATKLYAGIMYDTQQSMELAWRWGVLVPMGLLIAGGISYWVYRGFKPKVVTND
jgi:hypothetical protein